MGLKIENKATGRVQDPRRGYRVKGESQESVDSFVGVKPHWLVRLPVVAKALPLLSLTACGSSHSSALKIGVAVVAAAGVGGLYHMFNRRISDRRIAELPSPVQILKHGIPRLMFPRGLSTADKVIEHYMRKGFDEAMARRVAYAWFFHHGTSWDGIGDLNQYDIDKRDLHGITSAFPNLAGYPFDDHIQDVMDQVGCSHALGSMLGVLDRSVRTVPEITNIFLALNLKVYQLSVGSHSDVGKGFRYVLGRYSSRSSKEYKIRESDVGRMLETTNVMHRRDDDVVNGITHLLLGGMAMDAHEAGQYDDGLKVAFAHIWSARRAFEDSSALQNPCAADSKGIGTVTKDYCDLLNTRALDAWRKAYPEMPHPKAAWSTSMLPQTTMMLRSFAVKPV